MPGAVTSFEKGLPGQGVLTPVDDQANPLPVTPVSGVLPLIVEAEGKATAADPVYIEAALDPLSLDLAGNLRTRARAKATAAAPAYVEAAESDLSQNLAGDLRVIAKQSGTWTVTPTPSTTGTETSVASNVASVAILAANAARLGATVLNDGSNNLYLRLNVGAATTAIYTVKLVAGAYYEVPANYNGAISGIWDVATGSARVTELT